MDKHVFFQLARHNQDKQIHTCTNWSPGHKCDASTLLIMIVNYGKGLVAHDDSSNYCSHSRMRPLTSSTGTNLSEDELIQLTSTVFQFSPRGQRRPPQRGFKATKTNQIRGG